MVGYTLLHYNILAQLGQGGMGAVYKAQDKRLLRHVAIKLLRPELMIDRNKRLRFIKEAQTASSLNHPNICTIYDINENTSQHFIVMELVDGKNLRELLDERGAIPEPELTDITIAICEALSVVHAKGISHRDIKPENIMIASNGLVKVMDFGLAKLATEYAETTVEMEGSENWRNNYVDSVVVTNLSGLLGTVHYMSPEQAQGQKVDHRSDIFSLGAMLFELLTGQKPFKGETNLDILKKIITEPLNPDCYSQNISPGLQSILSRTLEKNPADRYQNVDELLEDLKKHKAAKSSSAPAYKDLRKESSARKRSTTAILIYSALLVTLIAILARFYLTNQKPVNNLYINSYTQGFCWDKDSETILFAANLDGTSALWKTNRSNGQPEKLISGVSIQYPDFNPESNRLVYQEGIESSNIWKIDLHNPVNEETLINSSVYDENPDISQDGKKILFSSNRTGAYNIWMCNRDGSNPKQITFFKKNILSGYGKWSPDGSEILVSFYRTYYLVNTSIGKTVELDFKLGIFPNWTIDGKSIYSSHYPEAYLFIFSKDGKNRKQLTSETGMTPKIYGNYIYYMKDFLVRDIWRITLDGKNEEPVLQGVPDLAVLSWDVVKDGIYFFRKNNNSPILCFYDFNTKQTSKIREIPLAEVEFCTITIDPEERYLLYTKREPEKSDIILVENFTP